MTKQQNAPRAVPLLFSDAMAQAIVDGTKTQTRRVIDKAPASFYCYNPEIVDKLAIFSDKPVTFMDRENVIESTDSVDISCPFTVGGRIWGRETFAVDVETGLFVYRAQRPETNMKWKASIHMPRVASRIDLKITGIRVERVQDIRARDVADEAAVPPGPPIRPGAETDYVIGEFAKLWDDLNLKRGFGWDKNPWVWAISFERVQPVDATA